MLEALICVCDLRYRVVFGESYWENNPEPSLSCHSYQVALFSLPPLTLWWQARYLVLSEDKWVVFEFWVDYSSECYSLECRRPGFDPWVWKIPWRRKWQPTPLCLPGESNGQRSLVGYSPWDSRVGHDWTTNTDRHLDNQVLCSISNFIKRINSITSLDRSEMLYLVSVKCSWWKKSNLRICGTLVTPAGHIE